ncbi:HNH endonuclease family protein [Saccharothrix stipae]
MIRLHRAPLAEPLQDRLTSLTGDIRGARRGKSRVAKARGLWKARPAVKRDLKAVLATFAAGRDRCMYCGDNEGTDIDHYQPVSLQPLLTFAWLNHLLACSRCNSHHKRDEFPVDDAGRPLLLDPSVDDPAEHLFLALNAGRYLPLTPRGDATIRVCALNRDVLTQGRRTAFDTVTLLLRQWAQVADRAAATRGEAAPAVEPELVMIERTVREQPFADVLDAMVRQATGVGADEVFEDRRDLLPVLRSPELRDRLDAAR